MFPISANFSTNKLERFSTVNTTVEKSYFPKEEFIIENFCKNAEFSGTHKIIQYVRKNISSFIASYLDESKRRDLGRKVFRTNDHYKMELFLKLNNICRDHFVKQITFAFLCKEFLPFLENTFYTNSPRRE